VLRTNNEQKKPLNQQHKTSASAEVFNSRGISALLIYNHGDFSSISSSVKSATGGSVLGKPPVL